ncbi:hypothetical protein Gotur_019213 [Gossypium turneri]
MTMDREKEREIELESAMYTNCLLLGLDPPIIGLGASNVTPRVGLFRHSNPKLGEQLLYFILSSLRGPAQSARDFDRVWPIFDSAQSRDFRKVVQGIISELEAQGALPRSNSRVSSLATCCGPRFVELLWQLSLHALREVYRRNFAADVASNPLPVPLTDVAFSHAATLLPITKIRICPTWIYLILSKFFHALGRSLFSHAFDGSLEDHIPISTTCKEIAGLEQHRIIARIALERRRFLKNAETTVQRQAMWSNLAHEMTAEFRGLCAEEAYLQQELEKLHDLRNKVKLEGELWDDLVSTSSQNSHLVSKATLLWESILSRKSQHEVLASGPIEDLIAHREHRYRISGSSLLAAMDQSSQAPYSDVLSVQSGDLANKDQNGGCNTQVNEETFSQVDDRSGRVNQTVDVAEIIRRWTHALQRIHKHSLQLAKANDGEGPDILRSAQDGSTSGHADSLATTLAEHQQHLASFQISSLINIWGTCIYLVFYTHQVFEIFKNLRYCSDFLKLPFAWYLVKNFVSTKMKIYLSTAPKWEILFPNAKGWSNVDDLEPQNLEICLVYLSVTYEVVLLFCALLRTCMAVVLINELKEVAPAIQKSISNCTGKVNGISSNLPSMAKHHGQATSPIQAQSSGRTLESSSDDVGDITPKMSKVQLDKISPSSPALKLPQLFSLSPNSLVKGGNMQKQHTLAPQTNQIGTLSERSSLDQPLANNGLDNPPQDTDDSFVQNLKRSVRQAALSVPSHDSESSQDSQSDESSEHFFVPVSSFNFYHGGPENKVGSIRSKKLFSTQKDNSLLDSRASDGRIRSNYDDVSHMLKKLDSLNDYDPVNVFLSAAASSSSASDGQRSFFDLEEAQDQVFSPSFLMDASLLSDSYEDLLDWGLDDFVGMVLLSGSLSWDVISITLPLIPRFGSRPLPPLESLKSSRHYFVSVLSFDFEDNPNRFTELIGNA